MKIVGTFAEVRAARSGTVALVPTMGFLHEGHVACVAAARTRADQVVMSLFVNPLQFDRPDDLARYPRDLDRDAAIAEAAGVDVLFAPPLEEMYPDDPVVRVHVSMVSEGMEGAHRPGHFDGVATVVAKLFAGIIPDVACFGRKDAQQLAVVTRMAADLSFPLEIVGVSTVREADGLALSSRNVFIEDRDAALGLSSGLFTAADAVGAGVRRAGELEGIVARKVAAAGADLDYATLADVATVEGLFLVDRPAFLAVAARVGEVRLIDNVFLYPDGTADRGTRLDRPSILYGK
ncbi:MAG: pantoate--beta-alanine ligase [Actinomycetota bacterium]